MMRQVLILQPQEAVCNTCATSRFTTPHSAFPLGLLARTTADLNPLGSPLVLFISLSLALLTFSLGVSCHASPI